MTNGASVSEKLVLKGKLNQTYADEEIYWRNRSRNNWMCLGDRNTAYFHATTKTKLSKHKLCSIEDDEGTIHRGDKEISEVAVKYFQQQFTATHTPRELYDEVFQDYHGQITDSINMDLIREVSEEEIYDSIFAIGPHKAPGPDGFSGDFYQKF